MTEDTKPPYRVPSMTEIEALPWNGYNVVSTFSGTGGSCLGYRMAGYRVVWASEFVPAAQESYKANHPDSILDTRDVREVNAQDICDATGLAIGEIDIFDGSPPCSAFSTAGKRQKGWGQIKKYSDTSQRVDDLFFEYARLIKDLQPKVFVAENVSGLVKGKAKGYFLEILKTLKECGYNVKVKLLDAQWLGVPQTRQRTIFIGVRNDLGLEPAYPTPLPYRYSVREAIPWIVTVDIGGAFGEVDTRDASATPYHTIGTNPRSGNGLASEVEAETDISRYAIGDEWERMGKPGTQSDKYFQLIRPSLDSPSGTIMASSAQYPSSASVVHPTEKRKFSIAELKRICAFPDDFIVTGSYAQQWERLGRAVPPVMMRHIAKAVQTDVLDKQ